MIAVATSAVRDAPNRERLLGPLRRREGIEVQILSGREEARLGASRRRRSLPLEDGVVADLGGASLQLTRLRKGHVASTSSRAARRRADHAAVPARTTRRRRASSGRSATEVRAGSSRSLPPAGRGEVMVGLGGTVRTLAGIHLRAPAARTHASRTGSGCTSRTSPRIRERLESRRPGKRRQGAAGSERERADIILAGAIVIEELMRLRRLLTLVVCTRGVRDGLLLRETFAEEAMSDTPSLRQSRAVLARVQPPRARGGPGPDASRCSSG